MLKFFRKIRQKLLSENKFSKYLIYAIGEIVLVVIGILIALSINNWNNNSINKIKEKQILESYKIDLQSNIKELERVIQKSEITQSASDSVLAYHQSKIKDVSLEQLEELIMKATGFTVYKTNEGTVQDVLGSGVLGIITNDEIRLSIGSWQAALKDIREWENLERESSKQYLDYLKERISIYKMRQNEAILTEPKKEELFADNIFLNHADTRFRLPRILNDLYKKELTRLDKLISTIEAELSQ